MPRKDDFHDDHKELLVKTATTVELLNTRLFGGDGQKGAIPFILEQHMDLAKQLDSNKHELIERIEEKKDQLMDKIDKTKQETDADIKVIEEKHESLNGKVNWFAGGIAALGTAATMIMTWFGIHHKG